MTLVIIIVNGLKSEIKKDVLQSCAKFCPNGSSEWDERGNGSYGEMVL